MEVVGTAKQGRSLNALYVRVQDSLVKQWTHVIKRYIRMAKKAHIDSTHRKFAIDRWVHRKHGREGTLTVAEWKEMRRVTNGTCLFCGSSLDITMEHMVPKSIGGGFTKENIVPACRRCNSARGNTFNVSRELFVAIELERKYERTWLEVK